MYRLTFITYPLSLLFSIIRQAGDGWGGGYTYTGSLHYSLCEIWLSVSPPRLIILNARHRTPFLMIRGCFSAQIPTCGSVKKCSRWQNLFYVILHEHNRTLCAKNVGGCNT